MSEPSAAAQAALRRGVYAILIALGVGNVVGRTLAVNSVDMVGLEKRLREQGRPDWRKARPFLSSNDRSRWATVRALVEHGTYAIDDIVSQPGWDTIDMVQHRGRDGQLHLYSSKPPLLATLMAGEYWLIHQLTGWTLGDHPYEIGRFMVLSINLPALLLMWVLLAGLAERLGTTDWGRLLIMAGATLGTFLTTFAVVINNHLIAAALVTAALVPALAIWQQGRRELKYFAACGLAAALAVPNELPSLALWTALAGALLWQAPRPTLLGFVPASAVVAAAAFGTNYLAHDSWRPPYAHRSEGDDWYKFKYVHQGKERESYWSAPKGIDRGEPSVAVYALHTLVGHHGIFSLTPLWLLSIPGTVLLFRRPNWRPLAALTAGLSLVCVGYYLFGRPALDRNYSGMSSGFRWVFWLTPLWLLAALPAADRLAARRWGQVLGAVLLALSVLSASYPTWNPWTHPWLMNLLLHLGWVTLPA
jgi:hypothetical protein